MNGRWSAPNNWPPGSRFFEAEGFVLLGADVAQRACSVPVLELELDFLDRPGVSKVLPVHPLGAQRLFDHARSAAKQMLSRQMLSDSEARLLLEAIWRKCHDCYCPGEPVRSAFDELMNSASKPSRAAAGRPTAEELSAQRTDYLAITCVVHGFINWLASGESNGSS